MHKEPFYPIPFQDLNSIQVILFYGRNETLQSFYTRFVIEIWKKQGPITYEDNFSLIVTSTNQENYHLFENENKKRTIVISQTDEKILSDIKKVLTYKNLRLILLSSSFNKRSSLVFFLEKHPKGLVLPCYEVNHSKISPLILPIISNRLKLSQVKFSKNELVFLVNHSCLNIKNFWSDLDKICCYFFKKKIIINEVERLLTLDNDFFSNQLEKLFLEGPSSQLENSIKSCINEGMTEVGILQRLTFNMFFLLFLKNKDQEDFKPNLWIPPSKLNLYRRVTRDFSREKLLEIILMLRKVEKIQKTTLLKSCYSILPGALLMIHSKFIKVFDSFKI